MFTGIVETRAEILKMEENAIEIARPKIFENLKIGQSIATNGACLSIVEFDSRKMRFEILNETFARTNLQNAKFVNLERALRADARFEGHCVLGHVDGVLKFLQKKGERFRFQKPQNFAKYFVEKGSIALDGVSLTIAKNAADFFEVAIIPQTLTKTNFEFLRENDFVNFECDILAKYFLQSLQKKFCNLEKL